MAEAWCVFLQRALERAGPRVTQLAADWLDANEIAYRRGRIQSPNR